MRGLAFHHMHKRKRIHLKHEKYPNPDKWKRLMDRLIYILAVLGPLMTIPQLLKIWIGKDVAGISSFTWIFYFIGGIFWLIYGVIHKEKPIILTNILWIVITFFIVAGIFFYK